MSLFCTTDYLEELKALDAGQEEEDARKQAQEEQVSVAWLIAALRLHGSLCVLTDGQLLCEV